MRRYLLWIAAVGVVVLAVIVAPRGNVPDHVSLEVLGETNINAHLYRMVLVSNGTHKPHKCAGSAWVEMKHGWSFGGQVSFVVPAGASKLVTMPVETNGPATVTVFGEPVPEPWKIRVREIRGWLGFRPPQVYEVEAKGE